MRAAPARRSRGRARPFDAHQCPAIVFSYDGGMNTAHTETHRQTLLRLRQSLLDRIAHERGGVVSRADMAAEHDVRASDARAQATTEINEEFAMNEHETAELLAIDAALQRLAQGGYGQCLDCGVALPEARLQACPTALRCTVCQTRFEAAHGGGA